MMDGRFTAGPLQFSQEIIVQPPCRIRRVHRIEDVSRDDQQLHLLVLDDLQQPS